MPEPLHIGAQRQVNGHTLTLTAEGWRAEPLGSMHQRAKKWNYRGPAAYLITLVAQHHDVPPRPLDNPAHRLPEALERTYARRGHPHLFGELGEGDEPNIVLTPFGREVERIIGRLGEAFPSVRVDAHVVMPNHVHMVVTVVSWLPDGQTLGTVVGCFKTWVNRAYKTIVAGVDREKRMQARGGLVFEAHFHDRILFTTAQRQTACAYVCDNPRRLWVVRHRSAWLKTVEAWMLSFPHLCEGGTAHAERWWAYYAAQDEPLAALGPRGLVAPVVQTPRGTTVTFRAIGRRELLAYPLRQQVQLSRSLTEEEVETQVALHLEACREGYVMVSPCISRGEQRVARAVMDAGFPLVVLLTQGIPPHMAEYKPYGRYFEACAQGRLLMLSPWEWQAKRTKVERWQCLWLNDIAAQIVAACETGDR